MLIRIRQCEKDFPSEDLVEYYFVIYPTMYGSSRFHANRHGPYIGKNGTAPVPFFSGEV